MAGIKGKVCGASSIQYRQTSGTEVPMVKLEIVIRPSDRKKVSTQDEVVITPIPKKGDEDGKSKD